MRFFTGAYTQKNEPGIFMYALDKNALRYQTSLAVPSAISLCADKAKSRLYAVSCEPLHVPGGSVFAFDISKEVPVFLSAQDTGGEEPCHLCLSPDGRYLYTANYTDGSVSVFPLDADGGIRPCIQKADHTGKGIDPVRQEKAHVHQVSFLLGDQPLLCAVDLGTDRLVVYRTGTDGRITSCDETVLPPGCGPRHICQKDEGTVYCVCELSNVILVLRRKGTHFTVENSISVLPGTFRGDAYSAAIRMYAGKLYVSCRGCDLLNVYDIRPDGSLEMRMSYDVPQGWPRDFALIDPETVLLCCQKGKNLICKMTDKALEPCFELPGPGAVTVQLIDEFQLGV